MATSATEGFSKKAAYWTEHIAAWHKSGLSQGTLHLKKTRLIEFGRFAAGNRRKRGEGKPETFDFLGFTHICATTRIRGWFLVRRKTVKKRLRAALRRIKTAIRGRVHAPISEVGNWLKRVVLGYYRYHTVPGNCETMRTVREDLIRNWRPLHNSLRS